MSSACDSSTVPLRRNRDFLLLWSGEVVSTLGSQISLVAFPLLVLTTTHSPAKAGLVGFANQVPVLAFYLPAGVLVDRRDRRVIMIASSIVGALALASVPVALALGHLPFRQIMIVAFLAGARQVVYSVAEQGALPLVVSPSQVSEAIVRNQVRLEAATVAGPPLGGLLFGAARLLPFAFDSISYVASALGAFLVRGPLQEPRGLERRSALADIGEAVRWFWAQSFLRASALAVAAANFMWMALELVLIVRARQHGAAPAVQPDVRYHELRSCRHARPVGRVGRHRQPEGPHQRTAELEQGASHDHPQHQLHQSLQHRRSILQHPHLRRCARVRR